MVYALKPLAVIVFAFDVKLIPVPGLMFFIIVPDKMSCESVTAFPELSVGCVVVIFVFMVDIFECIFGLSYASTPFTVIVFALDDKLIPVPGFILLIIVPDNGCYF
jgi:hypothetical protein